MQILYICSQYFWIFCKLRVLPCCIPKLQISQHKSMKNDMAVKTFTDYLYHLCNQNQVNLKNFDDFGDDFIQLQTFFHFEPIIYECFFLFVSGTAARSVRPITLAHDNNTGVSSFGHHLRTATSTLFERLPVPVSVGV